MTIISKNDFIVIDYTGSFKDTGKLFDTTIQHEAEKAGFQLKDKTLTPLTICVGQREVVPGLDDAFIGKKEGSHLSIDVQPEQGFGHKREDLIHVIPTSQLLKQNIRPFPGLQITLGDGMIGTIRSTSPGRTTIDFNHPLAGRVLHYEVTITKILTDTHEKLTVYLRHSLGLQEKEYQLTHQDTTFTLILQQKVPEAIQKRLKAKIKEILPLITFELR